MKEALPNGVLDARGNNLQAARAFEMARRLGPGKRLRSKTSVVAMPLKQPKEQKKQQAVQPRQQAQTTPSPQHRAVEAPAVTPGPVQSANAAALMEENSHLTALLAATRERAHAAENALERARRAEAMPVPLRREQRAAGRPVPVRAATGRPVAQPPSPHTPANLCKPHAFHTLVGVALGSATRGGGSSFGPGVQALRGCGVPTARLALAHSVPVVNGE